MKKAALILLSAVSLLLSCSREAMDPAAGETVDVRLAVVLPMSDESSDSYREALEWAAENVLSATEGLQRQIRLNYEWYDENGEDMSALASELRCRQDLDGVIGPYSSAKTREFASALRNWLLPVFTLSSSESVIRENIPAMSGGEFLWALQEVDISQCELLLTLAIRSGAESVSLLVKKDDPYGQTFLDWFGFQSSELGIADDLILEYTPESLESDFLSCLRSQGTDALIAVPGTSGEAGLMLEIQSALQNSGEECPSVFYSDVAMNSDAFSFDGGTEAVAEGVSVIASPESGFEVAYKIHSGRDMVNIESQIYDAAMLMAMAVFDTGLRKAEGLEDYDENNIITRNRAYNRALSRIVDGRERTDGAMTWQPDDMRSAFVAIENGKYLDVSGASGELDFDSQVHTNILHSSYCHWQHYQGKFLRINYMTSDGSRRTEPTLGCWNWKISGGQTFDDGTDLSYPAQTGRKAVLIAASCLWDDYRHQADVLHMYRILRGRGYSDDDILLVMEDNLAYSSFNPEPGAVRTSPDGENLYEGEVEVDYRLTELDGDSLRSILAEQLDSGSGDDLLLYWCGHGMPGNLIFGDEALDASWLRRTLEAMHANGRYRKLLCLLESCFAGSVAEACVGIPGALFITATNPNETSKAENFDAELDVYLSDRFSAAFRAAVGQRSDWTMAELYYELYNHTPGSHVTVYNSENYGNLYVAGLQEYLAL